MRLRKERRVDLAFKTVMEEIVTGRVELALT